MANRKTLIAFTAGFAAGVAAYALIRHAHDNKSTWDEAWALSSSPLSLNFDDDDGKDKAQGETTKTDAHETPNGETIPDKEYTAERKTPPRR